MYFLADCNHTTASILPGFKRVRAMHKAPLSNFLGTRYRLTWLDLGLIRADNVLLLLIIALLDRHCCLVGLELSHEITLCETLDDFCIGDELKDTTRMNEEVANLIRPHPEQYFWVHKRFKTRPPEEQGAGLKFYQ